MWKVFSKDWDVQGFKQRSGYERFKAKIGLWKVLSKNQDVKDLKAKQEFTSSYMKLCSMMN